MRVLTLLIWIALFIWVASGGVAFAGGGEEAGGSHVMEWVWKVLNFAILVFVLVKFFGPMLKGFLKQRSEAIEKTLNEARQARELAEKALAEVRERLKGKDKEIAEIIASAKESGEKEREALLAEADKLGRKILEQARANMDFELKRAKEAIRAEAVELAIELAEKKIKERLTPEEQKRLLEESLLKLETKA